MASNIIGAWGDLDIGFAARTSAKRADVGILSAGSDISNKYEKYVSGTKAAATGILVAGSDLNNYFAPPSTSGPIANPLYHDITLNSKVQAGVGSVAAGCAVNSNGSWNTSGSASSGGNPSFNGSWFLPQSAGVGSGYTVQYTWTPTTVPTPLTYSTTGSTGQLALSSNRAWNLNINGNPGSGITRSLIGTLNIVIRNSGGTVVSNQNVNYNASITG